MHILLRGVLVLVFTSWLCTSCADPASSVSLALPVDSDDTVVYLLAASVSGMQSRCVPLKALNTNAQTGTIDDPEKSDVMCFAFEKSPTMFGLTDSGLYALELEFEPLEFTGQSSRTAPINPNAIQTDSAQFAVGLLYANDFSAFGKLKENFRPQHPVTAKLLPRGTLTVSIGFAGIAVGTAHIRGFMVSAQSALRLKSAAVVPVRYGWLKDGAALWYGTTADGDVIPPELCTESGVPLRTEFPKPSAIIRAENTETGGRDSISIHFDKTQPVNLTAGQKQPRLSFQCGDKRISVFRAPDIYQLTLDSCLFSDPLLTLEQIDVDKAAAADMPPDAERLSNTDTLPDTGEQADAAAIVCGITIEYSTPSLMTPITADPGLIPDWPQEQWRQPSYELFSWEQFPSVLIFDFADYSVQDAYLKRLSFFAEKKGFTGKLLSDGALTSLHGFNAHDYRAETLAAFFQKAEEEHFLLNKSELHLRKILFRNGIIIRTETGIEAGKGAIVSISRQSERDLRYRFITHECLHGIYFTEGSFRDTVTEVFRQTNPRATLFLRRYFEIYPALQYNTDDDYLLQNEFMAYLLQQSNDLLQQYFVQLSWLRLMNTAEPALCRYIRKTKVKDFMQAAMQMDSFLYTTWGVRGGRISLANMETL